MKLLSEVSQQSGIVERVGSLSASSGTVTPNSDTADLVNITLNGNLTIGEPSGSPENGQVLVLRLVQGSPGGRTVTWNSAYRFPGDLFPTLHSFTGRADLFEFRYNASADVWDCVNTDLGGQLTGKVVGWNQRTTPTSYFAGTRIIALTTTASVLSGRMYQVLVSGEIEQDNAGGGNETIQNEIRITTDGSSVLTTSTQIGRGLIFNSNGLPVPAVISVPYVPSTSHTLKVGVVSFVPVTPTNNARWSAGADFPMTIAVVDAGPAIAKVP